jgi:predicted ArsR family transcriptional regulator
MDEKSILRHIMKNGMAQSVNMVKNALGITEYRARKAIEVLEERHLVRKVGNGPSTKYIVEIESVELLTQLQMAMEILKKQVT